jgi:hypothetical protein
MDVTSITDPDQMRAYRDGYAQGQIDGAKAKADAVADLIDAEIKHTESLTADEPGSYRHYALTPSYCDGMAHAARIARGES